MEGITLPSKDGSENRHGHRIMPGDAFRVPARKQEYPRCAPQVRQRGQKALHFNAYFAQPQSQTEMATALEQTLQPISLAGVVSSVKNRAGIYGGRSVEPINLPAGHFVLDYGYGAHPPDEYYVIESRNPKARGRCCALVRRVSV